MDIRHIKYFLAIAEEKSISRAAKKLYISQPPLSQQLRALEEELGVRLFERTTRSLEITDAGKVFRERALQIVELMGSTVKEVRDSVSEMQGTLSVGFVASSGAALLPHRIPDFNRHYPEITFKIREGSTHRILDLLNSGVIEVGIVRTPFNLENYEYIELPGEGMVAVAGGEFLGEEKKGTMSLNELEGLPLIIDKRFEKLIIGACQQAGFIPKVLCEGEDSRSLLGWASSGMGVAVVPRSAGEMLPLADVVVREIKNTSLNTKTLITWVRNRALSKAAQKFIETFEKEGQAE